MEQNDEVHEYVIGRILVTTSFSMFGHALSSNMYLVGFDSEMYNK